MDNYSEGLATGMALNGNGYNNNSGFLGGEWGGLIGLLIVASLFGGNGWGFGGNRGGSACATQADLSAGFANSEIMSDLNDILLGQASMQNYINQGFAGINQTVTNGFAGVNNAICTLGYQNQAGFNALSRELADCCCATQRSIDSVKYENAKNTCDIIRAGQDNTRAILDYLTNDKIEALRAENTALKGRISDDYQADRIINKLSPCPSPAYIVPNPNCCYNYGVSGVGYGNACGCNI